MMLLKHKLLLNSILLHAVLFALVFSLAEHLGLWLIAVELLLIASLSIFYHLINKGLKPLEYMTTFAKLLEEKEFTSRFKPVNQTDIDDLIEQFNKMLQRLYQERLAIGEQQGVFQKLMAESPTGVILLDYENHISEINPAAEKLLKLNHCAALGMHLDQFAIGSLKFLPSIEVNCNQLEILSDGTRLKVGHFQIHDRGFERSFFMLNELTSDILISQKNTYEKLIRLMSHEVNNTIAITNSLLQSCLFYQDQLDVESSEDYGQAIAVVVDRCASLNHFMKGYSDVVRLPKPVIREFNISAMLNNLVVLFYADCHNHSIEMKYSGEQNIVIMADGHLIEQAFVNILKNAIEAIGQTGRIDIRLQKTANGIAVQIIDSGSGISNDERKQLFSPFFTTKDCGQGIGLMLISEIFSQHGFQFNLENNNNDKGACFEILINTVETRNRSHKEGKKR